MSDEITVPLPQNEREHRWFYEEDGEPHMPVFGAVAGDYAAAYWDQYPGEVQFYDGGYVQEPLSLDQAEKLARVLLAAVNAARQTADR